MVDVDGDALGRHGRTMGTIGARRRPRRATRSKSDGTNDVMMARAAMRVLRGAMLPMAEEC